MSSKKKNWYVEADKSKDPAVKELLEKFNTVDANSPDAESTREEIKKQIQELLNAAEQGEEKKDDKPELSEQSEESEQSESSADSDVDGEDVMSEEERQKIVEELEPLFEKLKELDPSYERTGFETPDYVKGLIDAAIKANKEKETNASAAQSETPSFSYTENDAVNAKDIPTLEEIKKSCREEISRLEKTRLKHGTYKQNRELDMKIWAVRRIIALALKRGVAIKERARRVRAMSRVSGLALKRARFVKLVKQGISITNITKHTEGVKKEELEEVLDKNTIESCRKYNFHFSERWARWKEKYIVEPAIREELLKKLLELNPDYKTTKTETNEQLQELIDKAQEKNS